MLPLDKLRVNLAQQITFWQFRNSQQDRICEKEKKVLLIVILILATLGGLFTYRYYRTYKIGMEMMIARLQDLE